MIENFSQNSTCTFYEWSRNPHHAKFYRIFSTISVLTVLVVAVILGNTLVIVAVLLRRRLRSATGLLILSLGIADLLVGAVILPFSIANEVLNGYWIFGETWCTIWLTLDIWMCTASIYSLVAISIDRYIAIIKPLNYLMLVTKYRARCTVGIVWLGSFAICSPSFFLASSIKNINQDPCKCTPANAGRAYITFSAFSSFYVPMIIIVFVYFRIYIAARAATNNMHAGMMQLTADASKNTKSYFINHPNIIPKESLPMLRVHRGSSVANTRPLYLPSKAFRNEHNEPSTVENGGTKSQKDTNASVDRIKQESEQYSIMQESLEQKLSQKNTNNSGNLIADINNVAREKLGRSRNDQNTLQAPEEMQIQLNRTTSQLQAKLKGPLCKLMPRNKEKRSSCTYEKRLSLEIKAAKTVAIVTGCFIFCWLGFSLLYGLELQTNDVVWSVLFWYFFMIAKVSHDQIEKRYHKNNQQKLNGLLGIVVQCYKYNSLT
ncbi:7 transmembrane receptor [Dictyocaulus viviparus]|uniref:7 transmembrane receptor n=1 Tax=Dictyocaulus viviparus TaxID=29172 RepID=A0A0D8Y4P1_DICVI|nr:7 transmembrane receptor [Dictyocaulus viviparus]